MRSPTFSGQGSNSVPADGKPIDRTAIFSAPETKNSTFTITLPLKTMNHDTLIDRQQWTAHQHMSARTLDKVNSILSEDFARWLSENELIQGQIGRWMSSMYDQGWVPVSRVYQDYIASPQYETLANYLTDDDAACLTIARWVKHCSDAHWAGVDGLYDQFVDWVASRE